MILTRQEFDEQIKQGTLRLALIGMSNIGKSYTAQRIKKAEGFACTEIDEEIQKRMGNLTMAAMAKWMGHPYEDGYTVKAKQYMALETELTLAVTSVGGNKLLDATGSVINIGNKEKETLKNNWLIVYIQECSGDIDVLVKRYFDNPKPTIWGRSYHPIEGMSDKQSLLACYPELLSARAGQYKKLADVIISAAEFSNPDLEDKQILPLIGCYLA